MVDKTAIKSIDSASGVDRAVADTQRKRASSYPEHVGAGAVKPLLDQWVHAVLQAPLLARAGVLGVVLRSITWQQVADTCSVADPTEAILVLQ